MSRLVEGSADLPGIGQVSVECVGNTSYVTGFRGVAITPKGKKALFSAAVLIDDAMRPAFVVDGCDAVIAKGVPDIEAMVTRCMAEPRNQSSLFFLVHDRAQMDMKALKQRIKEISFRLESMLYEHRRGTTGDGTPTEITREMLDIENERVIRLTKPLLDRIDMLKELARDLSKWSHGDKTRTVAQIIKAHEREVAMPLPTGEAASLGDALAAAADGAPAVALPALSPFTVLKDIGIENRNVFYVTDHRGHSIEVERTDRLDRLDWQKAIGLLALQRGWPFEQESEYKRKVTDGDILLFDCTQPSAQALDRLCSAVARHGKDVVVVGFAPEATYVGRSSAILEALKVPTAEMAVSAPAP